MLHTMHLPYAPPDNPIHKGRATSTTNMDKDLHQLLFSHVGAHGHCSIRHLHDIPDDPQCVRHLSGMLLLYKLLSVCRPGRRSVWRWEKPQEGGGWIVFSKTFLSYVLKNCSQIQSLTWVQSLSAADNRREQRKKEHKQLYRFLPQTGSSPLPLALPRRVPLKCNIGLQVVQTLK